jgi:1,4-dihydroxy-2-naphthoyl-CoA synthase
MPSALDGVRVLELADDWSAAALVGSPKNMEGIHAFLDKRKPDFRKYRRRTVPAPAGGEAGDGR